MALIWTIGHWIAAGIADIYRIAVNMSGGFDTAAGGVGTGNNLHCVSLDLDGSTEYLADTSTATLGIAENFTIAFWVEPDQVLSSAHTIFQVGSGVANQIAITQRGDVASDPLRVFLRDDDGTNTRTDDWNGVLSANQWQLVAVTWDNDAGEQALKLYIDGIDQGAADSSTGTMNSRTDTALDIYIGANGSASQHYDGRIGWVAVWDSTLSAAELQALYNHGCQFADLNNDFEGYVSSANLEHWWRLGHDDTDIGKDYATAGSSSTRDVDTNAANIDVTDIQSGFPFGIYADFLTNENLRNTSDPTNQVGAGSQTIAFWFSPGSSASTSNDCIYSHKNTGNNNNRFEVTIEGAVAGDPIQLNCWNSSGGNLFTDRWLPPANWVTGQWYFVVLTFNGASTTGAACYIDGQAASSDSTSAGTGTMSTTARSVYVAVNGAAGEDLDGEIFWIAHWDAVLSAESINTIYNGGNPRIDLKVNSGQYTESANLVHWWRMGDVASSSGLVADRGNGTALDLEVNASNMTRAIGDYSTTAVMPEFSVGKFDGAGNDQFKNTATSTVGIANDWTIALRFAPDDPAVNETIFQVGPLAGANTIRFRKLSTGDLAITVYDSGGSNFKDYRWTNPFTAATWVHLLLTWNGTTLTLYINGVSTAPSSTPTDNAVTQTDTGRVIYIGTASDDTEDWDGDMAYVMIWNTALSAAAAQSVFKRFMYFDPFSSHASYTAAANLRHCWYPERRPWDSTVRGQDYVATGARNLTAGGTVNQKNTNGRN